MENEILFTEGTTFNAKALKKKLQSMLDLLGKKDSVVGSLEQSQTSTRCAVVVSGCVLEFSMMRLV